MRPDILFCSVRDHWLWPEEGGEVGQGHWVEGPAWCHQGNDQISILNPVLPTLYNSCLLCKAWFSVCHIFVFLFICCINKGWGDGQKTGGGR